MGWGGVRRLGLFTSFQRDVLRSSDVHQGERSEVRAGQEPTVDALAVSSGSDSPWVQS